MSAEDALRWAGSVVDGLGRGVDGRVLGFVAGLHRHGVITTMSCEGHAGRALPYPWVDLDPMSLPTARALLLGLPELHEFSFECDFAPERGNARLAPAIPLAETLTIRRLLFEQSGRAEPAEVTSRLANHAPCLPVWQDAVEQAAQRLLG